MERLAANSVSPQPALVPGYHPELGLSAFDTRREHLAVHQKPVREDHRRGVAARVLVADPLSVDLGEWH